MPTPKPLFENGNEVHICGVCGQSFSSESELSQHIREQGLVA